MAHVEIPVKLEKRYQATELVAALGEKLRGLIRYGESDTTNWPSIREKTQGIVIAVVAGPLEVSGYEIRGDDGPVVKTGTAIDDWT